MEEIYGANIITAKAAVVRAEMHLQQTYQTYLKALEADDLVNQVAFLLYQYSTQREEDWEGPVTWEHWHELQIEKERDGWREMAVELLTLIK